jgi:hypothetical protein
MSTEADTEKSREDSPEWHRARAERLVVGAEREAEIGLALAAITLARATGLALATRFER